MITARDHAMAFFLRHPGQSLTIQQLATLATVNEASARAVLHLMCGDGLAERVLAKRRTVADEYFGTPKLLKLGQ